MTKISMELNSRSIADAIKQLRNYSRELEQKSDDLCKELAQIGAVNASMQFSGAAYDGPKEFSVQAQKLSGNAHYAVSASGESVMFIEFGAGITMGYGHPKAGELGMGPGTWPDPHYSVNSKGERVENWRNDLGWKLPRDKGGMRTFGNPPNMPMYNTAQDLARDVGTVARRVFKT